MKTAPPVFLIYVYFDDVSYYKMMYTFIMYIHKCDAPIQHPSLIQSDMIYFLDWISASIDNHFVFVSMLVRSCVFEYDALSFLIASRSKK